MKTCLTRAPIRTLWLVLTIIISPVTGLHSTLPPWWISMTPRHFELKTKENHCWFVTLFVSNGCVWGKEYYSDGAFAERGVPALTGSLTGVVRKDGLLHVTYNFHYNNNIEPLSEEQLLKLNGDRLIIGKGKLKEHGPGQMVLEKPSNIAFDPKMALAEIKVLMIEGEERVAIENLVSKVATKEIGVELKFVGNIRSGQNWACMEGQLKIADGNELKDSAMQARLNRHFRAYLKKDDKGAWQVMRCGFYRECNDGSVDYFQSLPQEPPWFLNEAAYGRRGLALTPESGHFKSEVPRAG
jgi:hypothetical protein